MVEQIWLVQQLMKFQMYAYAIMPDHVHLLIQPQTEFNYSHIMFSIKKQFSHNVNRVMGYNQFYNNHDTCSPRRRASACAPSGDRGHHQNQIIDDFEKKLTHFRDAFAQKHPGACPHPRFAWQKSFYDHIIRNETDFYNHVKYISRQNEKHVTNGMVWLGDV